MAQVAIRALHWSSVPAEFGISWRHAGGTLHAFWPAPLGADACFQAAGFSDFDGGDDDALDPEWQNMVERAIAALERRFGRALPLSSSDKTLRRKPGFLARVLGLQSQDAIEGLSHAQRVLRSTLDDQTAPVVVEFGEHASAKLRASDGHRILWVSGAPEVQFSAAAFAENLAAGRPVLVTQLAWKHLTC